MHPDKLDAVGGIRRKKRRLSEMEAEEEKLSLKEYLARKMEGDTGPQRKRVRRNTACMGRLTEGSKKFPKQVPTPF